MITEIRSEDWTPDREPFDFEDAVRAVAAALPEFDQAETVQVHIGRHLIPDPDSMFFAGMRTVWTAGIYATYPEERRSLTWAEARQAATSALLEQEARRDAPAEREDAASALLEHGARHNALVEREA